MPTKDKPILCRDDKAKRAIGRFICPNTKALTYGKQVSYMLDCQHCDMVSLGDKEDVLKTPLGTPILSVTLPEGTFQSQAATWNPLVPTTAVLSRLADYALAEQLAVAQEIKDNPFFCHNPKSLNFSEEIPAEKLPDCIACPNGFCRQGKPAVDGYFPSEVE